MKRKIKIISIILLILAVFYLFFSNNTNKSSNDNENTAAAVNDVSQNTQKINFSEIINMTKWRYNKQNHVYYQLEIPYCSKPNAPEYQKLAVFVPEKYMRCTANEDNLTYSCERNMVAIVGNYSIRNAPIVMPIETPEYSAAKALTEYRDVSAYTDAGYVYVHAGCRGKEHGAPACVTDLKAAIRFIKSNNGIIAGNVEKIFVFGMGEGGGLAAVLGTSGDSTLYKPYLDEIGALSDVSDKIFGVMTWSPITNLDTANIAYEWNMGVWRTNMNDKQKKMSSAMAKAYAEYINKAGFILHGREALFLQHSKDGLYQNGTYYDFVKEQIEKSLTTFMVNTAFPHKVEKEIKLPVSAVQKPEITLYGMYSSAENYNAALNQKRQWVNINTYWNNSEIRSIADFVRSFKPAARNIGAFDNFNRDSNENILFAVEDGKPRHFDSYIERILQNTAKGSEYSTDLAVRDKHGYSVKQRLNMYTPMYYLLPSSAGYRSAKVAPFWRIRSGIQQTETALTTEINLWLALQQYPSVYDTDFALVWESAHEMAEEKDDAVNSFIKWVDKSF